MMRVFLTKEQWQTLHAGACREIWQRGGTEGPLRTLWLLLEEANKHKRFVIEVENPTIELTESDPTDQGEGL